MGILAWLDKQFPYDRKEKAQLFDELEKTFTDSPKPSEGISEPVISLIESLGRDEWELLRNSYVSFDNYILVNVFHEHLELLVLPPTSFNNSAKLCSCEWMTSKEKELVADAALVRALFLKNLRIRKQHHQERSKYMILVKDNNEQP